MPKNYTNLFNISQSLNPSHNPTDRRSPTQLLSKQNTGTVKPIFVCKFLRFVRNGFRPLILSIKASKISVQNGHKLQCIDLTVHILDFSTDSSRWLLINQHEAISARTLWNWKIYRNPSRWKKLLPNVLQKPWKRVIRGKNCLAPCIHIVRSNSGA